jgi:hypothetical protein
MPLLAGELKGLKKIALSLRRGTSVEIRTGELPTVELYCS